MSELSSEGFYTIPNILSGKTYVGMACRTFKDKDSAVNYRDATIEKYNMRGIN